MQGINFKPAAAFLGGLFEGLIQDDHLSAINACVTDVESVKGGVETSIADFKKKDFSHILAGISTLGKTLMQVTGDIATCGKMTADISRVKVWVTKSIQSKDFVNTVIRNILMAGPKVQTDIDTLQKDADAHQDSATGEEAANLLVLALGAIPAATPENMDYFLF